MLESSSIGKPRVTESMCTESVAGSEPTLVTTLFYIPTDTETLARSERDDMTEKNQKTETPTGSHTHHAYKT